MNFYDFTVVDDKSEEQNLSQYEGKVVLVVNTATQCGLTPQYEGLEELYKKYKDQGLVILDFPCNQFLEQAPGTIEEINEFCTLNYNTTFPRFSKIDVNGDNTHPLFAYLKAEMPVAEDESTAGDFYNRVEKYTPYLKAGDIRWNFNKFLIGKDGNVIARFSPALTPDLLDDAIKTALAQ